MWNFELLFVLIFISVCSSSCPLGLRSHNGVCYFFSNSADTWPHAQIICKDRYGGSLVEINSATENSFLVAEGRRHGMYQFWIGGRNDMLGLGDWMWAGSRTHILQGYTNWAPGYPMNHIITRRPIEKSCAQMRNGQWIDTPCDGSYYYVCEV